MQTENELGLALHWFFKKLNGGDSILLTISSAFASILVLHVLAAAFRTGFHSASATFLSKKLPMPAALISASFRNSYSLKSPWAKFCRNNSYSECSYWHKSTHAFAQKSVHRFVARNLHHQLPEFVRMKDWNLRKNAAVLCDEQINLYNEIPREKLFSPSVINSSLCNLHPQPAERKQICTKISSDGENNHCQVDCTENNEKNCPHFELRLPCLPTTTCLNTVRSIGLIKHLKACVSIGF